MKRYALLAALAVLLAGCSGVISSDAQETVTPAPVPTDELRYPPGVTSDRVVAETLVDAHVRSLATTNYTLTTRQTVRLEDGTLLRQTNQTRAVARNGEAYRGLFAVESNTFRTGQEASEIAFWSNRSIIATRYTSLAQREPEFRQWSVEGEAPVTDLADERYLEGYLAGVDVGPTRRTADGGAVLVGTSVRDQSRIIVPLIVREPTNVTLQLRVRYDGVVLAGRVVYDASHNGYPVTVEREMRLTDIGSTTVERPPWVGNETDGRR